MALEASPISNPTYAIAMHVCPVSAVNMATCQRGLAQEPYCQGPMTGVMNQIKIFECDQVYLLFVQKWTN